MTREQEDKIIAQAKDIKVNLHNLLYYGIYYQGALIAVRKVTESLLNGDKPKADDWVYLKAEWDLITSSKRNMQLFLDGTPTRYRNHKHNKKGKLESVECYFVEYRNVITEVK